MGTTTLAMLEELEILSDLGDLPDGDQDFIDSILDIVSANGDSTLVLTDEQAEKVAQIYRKHCG